MPGNQNSGRRKSAEIAETEKTKKKRGRPPKESPSDAEERETVVPLSHVSTLSKRKSEIAGFYDLHLGPAIQIFPPTRLPIRRLVLQRYRALRAEAHTTEKTALVNTITKELVLLWDRSSIPHKSVKDISYQVKSLINKWTNSNKEEKIDPEFQVYLDHLLDLRTIECQDMVILEKTLKKSGNVDWRNDLEFMKGQLKVPQIGSLSTTKDKILDQKVKRKSIKAAKANEYASKNAGDFVYTSQSSSSATPSSSKFNISEENIVIDNARTTATSTKTKISAVQRDESEEGQTNDLEDITTDPDWELPVRERRRQAAKPKNITITFPANQLPSIIAGTSVATQSSIRHDVKYLSAMLKAGGADINDCSLSVSTVYRQRKKTVTSQAENIKRNIKAFGKEQSDTFVVMHWDGKIIQLLDGTIEDRLAVAISSPNEIPGQFLASPIIPDGTGLSMANAVHQIGEEYGLNKKAEAMVFDTTASNTGQYQGSVTRYEVLVGRALFWLACRHHIAELHVKHANELLRGPSDGPDDKLFKKFKEVFPTLSIDERMLWVWPVDTNSWRYEKAFDVLIWADEHMELATWAREDYRELLELVVLFLGGQVKRVRNEKVQEVQDFVRKPGAIHRARFMASCLYILKICMYRGQLDADVLDGDAYEKIQVLAEYIALLHVPYFLQTPLAASAPRLDRNFWNDLNEYQECFLVDDVQYDMINAVKDSVLLHLWYLCEELVVFALFDDNLVYRERQAMAHKLLQTPRPDLFLPGKPIFPTTLMDDFKPTLDKFIGPKSWLLFHKLDADGAWLADEVELWKYDAEYIGILNTLHDLKVVNDLAERCVKDVEEFRNASKDPEHRDNVLLVGTDHRDVFKDLRKSALR